MTALLDAAQESPRPPLAIRIGPATAKEMPYVIGSWAESYKLTPKMQRMPWGVYKDIIIPELRAVLDRGDVEVLCAFNAAGEVVGWVAFTRGRRVSTIHWIHTRYRVGVGDELRRRGVATRLLDAAQLGNRLAYTFRGPLPRHRESGDRITADEPLVKALAQRGVTAVYVPYQEWRI